MTAGVRQADGCPRAFLRAGLVVVHRVPVAPTRPSCCRPAARCRPGRASRRRTAPRSSPLTLRRRRRHGRRPPRDDGQRHRQPRHGEGLRGRRLQPASASPAPPASPIELVRLFQVELEHYEKIEGALLSLEGKANRLATMIRGNLGMAMQGLAVVPLFAGFDLETGGRPDLLLRRHRRLLRGARPPQRRLGLAVRPRLAEEAVARRASTPTTPSRVAVEALYDAADDDSATGGPDLGAADLARPSAVVDARRRRAFVRRRRARGRVVERHRRPRGVDNPGGAR